MSFAKTKILSLTLPLIPKSLISYEERLQLMLGDLRVAVGDLVDEVCKPEFLGRIAKQINDLGQQINQELAALETQPMRAYEDEKKKHEVVRRYRTELSRLLQQSERQISCVPKPVSTPITSSPSMPPVSTSIFTPALYDQERSEEIRQINSSLTQIHALLRDFSQGVAEQGEKLRGVETKIEKVTSNANVGLRELTKTLEKQEGMTVTVKIALALALFIVVVGVMAWVFEYTAGEDS